MSPDLAHLQGLWTDAYLTHKAVRRQRLGAGESMAPLQTARRRACAAPPAEPRLPTAPPRPSLPQGSAELRVEQRGGGEGFGKGHKVALPFGEALARMAAGDASLYLTTQVRRAVGAAGRRVGGRGSQRWRCGRGGSGGSGDGTGRRHAA